MKVAGKCRASITPYTFDTMRRLFSIIALTITLIVLCSCSDTKNSTDVPLSATERIIQDAKRLYKEASVVATGICLSTHIGENGSVCSDVELINITTGKINSGDIIHCINSNLTVSKEYLLYLSNSPYIELPDNEFSFSPIGSSSIFEISNDKVNWYGTNMELEELNQVMLEYNNIVTAPSVTYYYSELNELINDAEEIFIGRVVYMTDMTPSLIKSYSGSTASEKTVDASFVSVHALGSLKGKLNYGDNITIVFIPNTLQLMTNSLTLDSISFPQSNVESLYTGNEYVFFLIASPDSKQYYYFPVNPVQGWISLGGDHVYPHALNAPFSNISSLDALITAIKNVL